MQRKWLFISLMGAAAPLFAQSANPQISIILDGVYYNDSIDGDGFSTLEGAAGAFHTHSHAHEHGEEEDHAHHADHGHGLRDGFQVRSAEVTFQAAITPKLELFATGFFGEGGARELEEAYLAARALPGGFGFKAGKFLSDIGYLNNQHPHTWDFVDQNLAYSTLLGEHGLMDKGVQLTWLAPLPIFTRLGIEALAADEQERFGAFVGHEDDGFERRADFPRLTTVFAKFAPDLGRRDATQFGLWWAHAEQQQEVHPEPAPHGLQGDADLYGLDWVYKHDSGKAYGEGDWKLQAEYLRGAKHLNVVFHETKPAVVGQKRDFTEDAVYVQGTWFFAPRWEAGLRWERAGLTVNEVEGPAGRLKDWDSSDRWSAMLTFHFTEYTRARLQLSQADIATDDGNESFSQVFVQVQHAIGAHGAHPF